MSNPAIEWMKKNPALTAGLAVGVGLLVWLLTRSSGGSSNVAAVAQSNAQQEALATQNAAVQAQAQVQENQAALAAQVQNNNAATALAASVAQINAQNNQTEAAKEVALAQTNEQGSVASSYINAELQAQQTQVNAESNLVNQDYAYRTAVATSVLPGAVKNLNNASNISANATNIIDTILGNSNSAIAASATNVGYNQAKAAQNVGITNSIVGGVSSIFSGLFG